ncbi:MAG TPA: hypothetical protein VKP58_01625 [Candidatus Acidoferrum sp.]|nr:hypothetical protein [Candidatus Acidoferrum sp.]
MLGHRNIPERHDEHEPYHFDRKRAFAAGEPAEKSEEAEVSLIKRIGLFANPLNYAGHPRTNKRGARLWAPLFSFGNVHLEMKQSVLRSFTTTPDVEKHQTTHSEQNQRRWLRPSGGAN